MTPNKNKSPILLKMLVNKLLFYYKIQKIVKFLQKYLKIALKI